MWASQVALAVKNPPANAADARDAGLIPGWEDPLEESMATHSSIFAWRILMDTGAWWTTAWGHIEMETTERISTAHSTHRDYKQYMVL